MLNTLEDGSVVVTEATRDEALTEWTKAKQALDYFKDREMMLRKSIITGLFPQATIGTNNLTLPGAYELKAVLKNDYSIQKDDVKAQAARNETIDPYKTLNQVLDAFVEIGGDVGGLLADRLIKWEPTVSVSEYKLLTQAYRELFDKVLVIKPASPELKLIPPAAKKR
jgi:hypothetical protein